MLWQPQYHNSDRLVITIRQIGETLGEIRRTGLAPGALARLEYQARELSSFASTSIEGNPLPLTDVKRLLKQAPAHTRDTEREVLNYNRALEAIYSAVQTGQFRINRKVLQWVQGMVVDGLMDNKADIGRLRQHPVVIRDPRQLDAIVYLPPNYQDVPALTDAMLTFISMHIGKLDPFVLAGLFHRQCVIIHPFMDGNGRATRLFSSAILGMAGVDMFRIFSFENYYNRNISRYFREVGLQGDYDELQAGIDFTSWLEYFADGILDELKRVQKNFASVTASPRLATHHQQVLDFIDEHGGISQQEYGKISQRSLAARKKDFRFLLAEGLIEMCGKGRSTYYRRSG